MDWLSEGIMVTILGIGVVFAVLIFISLILYLFGRILNTENKKTSAAETKTAVNVAVPKADINEKVNDDMELIAVITAAIAASECAKGNNIGPDKLVVRSLRRVNTWNKETMHEQHSTLF